MNEINNRDYENEMCKPCREMTVADSMKDATRTVGEINNYVRRLYMFLFTPKLTPNDLKAEPQCFIDECKLQSEINKDTMTMLIELCDRLGA